MVEFFVPGVPKPKGSMKAFKTPAMRFPVLKNDNPSTKPWQATVSLAAQAAGLTPTQGPVCLRIWLYFSRPRGHYGTGKNAAVLKRDAPPYPTTKTHGDWDKHGRVVSDALTGIAYVDDSQVVEGGPVHKRWASAERPPGARVVVVRMDEDGAW